MAPLRRQPVGTRQGGQFAPSVSPDDPSLDTPIELWPNQTITTFDVPPDSAPLAGVSLACLPVPLEPTVSASLIAQRSALVGLATNTHPSVVRTGMHNVALSLLPRSGSWHDRSTETVIGHASAILLYLISQGWVRHNTGCFLMTTSPPTTNAWHLSDDQFPPGLQTAMLCLNLNGQHTWAVLEDGTLTVAATPPATADDLHPLLSRPTVVYAATPPAGGGVIFDVWAHTHSTHRHETPTDWSVWRGDKFGHHYYPEHPDLRASSGMPFVPFSPEPTPSG